MPESPTSVWVLCVPDYDNYDFELYATREAALNAIRAKIGVATGVWTETYEGCQIEFEDHTPVRNLYRGKRIWSLREAEVHA